MPSFSGEDATVVAAVGRHQHECYVPLQLSTIDSEIPDHSLASPIITEVSPKQVGLPLTLNVNDHEKQKGSGLHKLL